MKPKAWDWNLVKTVSRSFYISLRFLPPAIREGVALAYLLARSSDTLADSGKVDVETRLKALHALTSGEWDTSLLAQYKGEGLRAAEENLLQTIPELLFCLKSHPDADLIREVFIIIASGQIMDLENFSLPDAKPLSLDALEDYTWRVAGCVGKFWTQICFRHIPNMAIFPKERMIELGIEYGKGLQLVNILRDRNEDMVAGRIYFKTEDKEILLSRAERALDSGRLYVSAVRNFRIRFCSRLPYEIALPTLALVCRNSKETRIRISRLQIYWLMFWCLMDAVFQPKR